MANFHKKLLVLSSAVWAILVGGRTAGHIFRRETCNDYFIKILFLLSKWFQTRSFLWKFAIGKSSPQKPLGQL
jgi:hypothetical protein